MLTAYIQYLGWLWWVRKLSFCFPFVSISWQHFMLRTGMLVPWTNVQQIMCFGLVSQSTSLEPVINALIATTLYSQAQWRPQRIFTNLNIHLKNIWLHIHGHKLPGIFYRYSNRPIVFKENGKATDLIHCLRHIFTTFDAPEELTTDGGPKYTSGLTRVSEFMRVTSWTSFCRKPSCEFEGRNRRQDHQKNVDG